MKLRMFLISIAILVLLGSFFFYRSQPVRLEIVFDLALHVLPESSQVNGTGWIYNNRLNFSVLKWPGFADEQVNVELKYPNDKTRELPVKYLVILRLNQDEQVIEIPAMKNVGEYLATIHCYFDDIKSGNYNLAVRLFVDGSNDIEDEIGALVFIP